MAVAFDAVGPSAAGQGVTGSTTTLTWDHTCSGTNRFLVVGLTMGRNSTMPTISTATYGGVTLTAIPRQLVDSASGVAYMFYLVNPPSGTNAVVLTRTTGASTWMQGGSISFTGASGLGTPVSSQTKTATVNGTAADSMVVDVFVAGNTIGTSQQTQRWKLNVNATTDGNNGAGSTAAGGGNITMGYATSSAHFAIIAAEVLAAPQSTLVAETATAIADAQAATIEGETPNGTLSAETATASAVAQTAVMAAFKFVADTSGLYFVDQAGNPILIRGDTVWALPVNAGRWNGGDWQADIDAYMAARATQGYNALYMAALGSTQNEGPANTGANENGDLPFVGGDPGTLNDAYWERVDYIFDQAEANGITVFMDLAYSSDLDDAALSGKSNAQFTGYGTAIGTRYKDRPNLVYTFGGDYFDTFLTKLTNVKTALRAAGDTHVLSVENYPESTSRFDLSNDQVQDTGTALAEYNLVYTYNWTYFGVEYAHMESSPIPVLWNDGHYDQDTTADRRFMRNLAWWALVSGSRGLIIGTEDAWGWPSGGLSSVTSPGNFAGTDLPTICNYVASLTDWHLLLPDTDNSLITAGRGTKAGSLASGGSAEVTSSTTLSDYVGASVTPDGSLALVYIPTGATITVDDTELAASYTVTKVDPVTCATSSVTPATSYGSFGNNSQGQADWVLVFQASTSTDATLSAELAPASAAGQAATLTGDAILTAVSATATAAAQNASFAGQTAATLAAQVAASPATGLSATFASEATVAANVAGATATTQPASFTSTAALLAQPATATAAGQTATLLGGANVAGQAAQASAAVLSATFTTTAVLVAQPATATATGREAAFSGGALGTLAAVPAEATTDAQEAAFASDQLVTGQTATATAAGLPASLTGTTTATLLADAATATADAPTATFGASGVAGFTAATATAVAAVSPGAPAGEAAFTSTAATATAASAPASLTVRVSLTAATAAATTTGQTATFAVVGATWLAQAANAVAIAEIAQLEYRPFVTPGAMQLTTTVTTTMRGEPGEAFKMRGDT